MRHHIIAKIWAILCLLILSSLVSVSFADTVLLDGSSSDPIELGPHYQLYVDNQNKLSIEDILSPDNKVKFSALVDGNFNLGYRKQTHWFKVNVSNESDHPLKQLLEFNFPLLDYIGVYIVNKSSKRVIARYDAGDTRPFHSRLYQNPNFIFPLTLPAKSDLAFYFRIKSKGSMTAGATLWQPDIFPEQNRLNFFYLALYFGLLIGLICYNFLLFLSIKEISYFYYTLFASSMLLAVGSFNGFWFELLWPNQPEWHNMSVPIFFSLTGFFAALFSKYFLQTANNAPRLDKMFIVIIAAFAVTLLATPFVSLLYIAPIISACAVALAFTSILSGITLSLRGNRFAHIYLIAWIIFMLGTGLFSARNMGWLPSTTLTRYGIVFGSALEMILLSFALAQRINILTQLNDDSRQEAFQAKTKLINVLQNSERELLHRVKDRTEALEEANNKLLSQGEELKKLAHYDPLTGLANRTLVNQQTDLLLTRCKRDKTKLAVLFLDLDGFKPINDRYGHKVGDDLLIIIANKLRKTLRDTDIICRLGGDEFIVIIESGHGDFYSDFSSQEVDNKIKKSISQRVMLNGYSIQIGVSIGSAIYPDEGESLNTLISVADKAMYTDKKARKESAKNPSS